MLESPLIPNLLYLALVIGTWLAALALLNPGTGIIEVLALVTLGIAGVGMIFFPVNLWALALLVIGLVLFGLSVWRFRRGLWLALSIIALTAGSAFLYASPSGGPAVNLLLALVVTAASVGFFWLMARSVLKAHQVMPDQDPARLIGQVGEARSAIDPVGSAYVGGELWTVKAESTIPPGTRVRVSGREGLLLVVEPDKPKREGE
ncbi:MAG: NfeD family protein [Anaerolineales bacterium]